MNAVRRALVAMILLCGVLAIGAVVVGVRGWRMLHPGAGALPADGAVTATPEAVERGDHLAAIACASCHSGPGRSALTGGETDAIDPSLGQVRAPNLTPAGVMGSYRRAELARAVRDGIGRDGRRLLGMPAAGAAWSDADLDALYAYLRSGPAVESVAPPRRVSPTLALLAGAGRLDVRPPRDEAPFPGPRAGMTPDHGRALAGMLGCATCHGSSLRGGRRDALVTQPGGDLVAFAERHSVLAFDDAMRRGVGPDGTVRDRSRMPYASYRSLTDAEVGALYTYLQSLNDAR